MPHPLTAYTIIGYFDAATVTNNPSEFWAAALILSARALETARGTEYTLAEKSVFLRPECSVIYSFRFLYLSAREFTYSLRGGELHANACDVAMFSH
jgi:hypothetical protein